MADQLIYTAEKSLKEAEGKIDEELKRQVEDKITALKSARDSEDLASLRATTEALSREMQKIGEAMMKNKKPEDEVKSETDNTNPNEGDDKNNDGPIRDAEVKE